MNQPDAKFGPGDVLDAARRIEGLVEKTPVINHPELDKVLGCELWLKCDHEQPTGAFKLRGASHAVGKLTDAGIDGDVATHSSGNHGAALAWAARAAGRKAKVVMPETAVAAKVESVRRFGGEVVFCEPTQAAREAGLARLVTEGLHPIPPYDHPDIILGQGTAALELFESAPALDDLVVPVGGGGLLAGTSIAAETQAHQIRVYGAEPAGAADTATSLAQGERVTSWDPQTVADGLRALVGVLNFEIIREKVEAVLLADDQAMEDAMKMVFRSTKMAIEPSAAIALAVIAANPERFKNRKVGVIVTGGNVDLVRFPWLAADSENS